MDIERLRKRLTTVEVGTVPGAGSYIQEERPDAVLEEIDKLPVPQGVPWRSFHAARCRPLSSL